MEPERRKEWIKTALIAALFMVLALVMLDALIGNPAAFPTEVDR